MSFILVCLLRNKAIQVLVLRHSCSTSISSLNKHTNQIKIITDWESFTPIITHASGSATNYTAFGMMRQVGDTYEVMSSMKFSAASAAFNELYMRVPKNGSFDFNKMPLISGAVLGNSIGGGHSYDAGVTFYPGIVQPRAPNIVEMRTAVQTTHTGTAAVSAQSITNTFPFTYNSGDTITMRYAVPIVGLSAGARMSDGYDGSPLYLKVQANNTTSPLTLTTTLQAIPFPTVARDPLGCFNTTTGVCTVPRSSFYCVIS